MALIPWAIALSIIAMVYQTERILKRMTADRATLDAALQQLGTTLQTVTTSLKSKATPDEDYSFELRPHQRHVNEH